MLQILLEGRILQQGCKTMVSPLIPSGAHKCLRPFCKSTSGMAGSVLPAPLKLYKWVIFYEIFQ